MGCSPKGQKELDRTERLSMHRGELELDKQRSSLQFSSVQFSHSVMSDSLWPHGLRMPGFPIYHQLLEPTQTPVHRINDVIQPSYPLSSRKSQMCCGRRCELSLNSSFFLSQEQNSYAHDHWNEDCISHLPDWVLAPGVKASLWGTILKWRRMSFSSFPSSFLLAGLQTWWIMVT